MKIRTYQSTDLMAIRQLFKRTILQSNAKDYSAPQLAAWIGTDDEQTRTAWQQSLSAHLTLVAIQAGQLIGFADMTTSGYLDRLYVAKDYQCQGVATALVTALEAGVAVKRYTTAASITARPFFECQGYQVSCSQQVERQGILLTNYLMQKTI
ncbi:GNAT family N-acetyltransferase [Lactiplantibacillus sp. WILCCON 0030]|uniref:GNAT family N-acetyltransferase n=1 Tax=Lactiplantibacillus brownii TaxID=3069269 RepID=A0ABU1ABM2_9LACO|nr:GNAT family N-acetyltransferase [Lactiplantibacillus brownii]MDQ7938320.1 GNAT family N-acetyltransferase [Lactiplantibacillus brownii]